MTLNDLTWQLNNGVLLNSDALGLPFVDISGVTGFDNTPYRETTRDHEGVDGGFLDAQFETGRDIVLDGLVYADVTVIESYLDSLKANYAPVSNPIPLVFKAPGVNERVIFVKPRGCRYVWDDQYRLGIVSIQFQMYAEDPRFYDNNLQGVSIGFAGLATTGFGFNPNFDRFTRNVSNAWGTSDTGDVWVQSGGSASDYSVIAASDIGRMTLTSVNVFRSMVVPAATPNFDVVMIGNETSVANATGAAISQWVQGRRTDANNYYTADLFYNVSPGAVSLGIGKNVAGVASTIGGPVTVQASGHLTTDLWVIRFQGWGNQLRAKAWKIGNAEPAAWTIETTDSALTTGSNYALAARAETGNTNSNPNVDWVYFEAFEGFGFPLGFGPAVPASSGSVFNGGNRPTPAVMTIQGPCVNPRIINSDTGESMNFIVTLGASDILSIDTGLRTVLLNGSNARTTLQAPVWFQFPPGTTHMSFGGTSGSGATLTIQFRNAWR